ncbi:MAG: DUF3604 domain-containing protein [Deltaproteobacteria bacterium]|nr:DUF3604 domain-containing protein [Deltaproteobacteria bacterium]
MSRRIPGSLLSVLLLLAPLGCSEPEADVLEEALKFTPGPLFEKDDERLVLRPPRDPDRRAFFGDLHVHTTYSFDAFAFGTIATPYDAYRYATGEAIRHPGGFDVQLSKPLDFYAVTDHAMFLGVAKAAADTSTAFSRFEIAEPLHDLNAPDNNGLLSLQSRLKIFASFIPAAMAEIRNGTIEDEAVLEITRTAWQDTIDAAETFNRPGRFTTFVAYEYTSSTDDRGNLHRNVIFKGSDELPAVPFSRFHSQNPEGLWDWMDGLRAEGIESLAIPHNSNGSNGQMFKLVDWAGNPLDDAYTRRRIRNEPLVEITQVKGTSETHPALSPNDEFSDFEIMPFRVGTMLPSEPSGSYVRQALKRGLALESQGITNPYEFGFVGASDTHTGATSDDESNFFSKIGLLDATAELRGSVPVSLVPSLFLGFAAPQQLKEVDGETYLQGPTETFGASGLTGVWAEENTRDAIYESFRRKETFATSGPRIRLRFFAGYGFGDDLLEAPDAVARAYADGVSMGSQLPAAAGEAPGFLLWALADPTGTPLQRLQIVKGWVDTEGETFETVYDVACSGGASVDPETNRCPDNGAGVDLSDCSTTGGAGDTQLRTLWRDPDFSQSDRAFYYARVLENPTCRWSTWDALRAGVSPRSDLAKTLQERAWTSPIQLLPAN